MLHYENTQLDEKELEDLVISAKDWAVVHGYVKENQEKNCVVNHANFMLFPTPFPDYLYKEAMEVQRDFQTLYHRASLDHEFIREALTNVIIHDGFMRKLYELYEQARSDLAHPKFYFSITRSDYMMSENQNKDVTERPYELQQIEMNTMAVGYAALSPFVARIHQYIANELGERSPYNKNQLALHDTHKELGEAMASCFKAYGNERAIVLFIVSCGGFNKYDQRHVQYAFQERVKCIGFVPCLFRNLQQIYDDGELTKDLRLLYKEKEVAICYFRTGYSPETYKTDDVWKARLMIERSCCIKCPTLGEQLVGTKKIQQVMAMPGVVERFIDDEEAVKRIQRTFAGLYSLDPGKDGDEAARKALLEPSKYVLKPQREGGGNNLYDDVMVSELQRMSNNPLERSQYILMDRLRPHVVKNYAVRFTSDVPSLVDSVSELGILGVFFSDGKKELINQSVGHLLKSKDAKWRNNEVLVGRVSCYDSPLLI